MNREEVFNYLRSSGFSEEQIKTIEGAFTCEDAISRQAVLDVTWEEPSYTDALNVLTEVRDKVKALPPVSSSEKQEPKSEWQQDHEILKAYSDGASAVLDNVRAEISEQSRMHMDGDLYIKTSACMQIIDKYAEEGKT